MRMSTVVWAQMESKGKPADTKVFHGTNREMIFEMARWLHGVHMGSMIRVTLARSEEDLIKATTRRVGPGQFVSNLTDDVDLLIAELEQQGELLDGADRPNPHMPESEIHNET